MTKFDEKFFFIYDDADFCYRLLMNLNGFIVCKTEKNAFHSENIVTNEVFDL